MSQLSLIGNDGWLILSTLYCKALGGQTSSLPFPHGGIHRVPWQRGCLLGDGWVLT